MKTPCLVVSALFALSAVTPVRAVTLRIVNYNIAADVDGYTSARPGLDTVLEAIGEQGVNGVAQPPDVIALEETTSNAKTVTPLAATLNSYYGDSRYAASPFQATEDGGDPSTGNGPNAVIYNTQTLTLLASVGVGTPKGSSNGEYRQVARYEFQPTGGTAASVFYVYIVHAKSSSSGSASTDEKYRAEEAAIVRADSAKLPADAAVLYMGDFNEDGSFEKAYQDYTASGTAQGVDPANTNPQNNDETWNSATYVSILTEESTDLSYRDDIQFVSTTVFNGTVSGGLRYLAGSYRAFGNNGTTKFGKSVNSSSNTALNNLSGPITASQALSALTTASDHLPVVADYAVDVSSTAPVITSAATAAATQGQAFSYQITATNHPTRYGVQGLPGGLTVNAQTGVLAGAPKTAGTFNLTLNASNSAGKGSGPLTLTVTAAPPTVTSASTASATVGEAFTYQITATNYPTSFGVQGLPAGFTVNATTGVLAGTPKTAGTVNLTLNAYNSAGKGSGPLTLTISQP